MPQCLYNLYFIAIVFILTWGGMFPPLAFSLFQPYILQVFKLYALAPSEHADTAVDVLQLAVQEDDFQVVVISAVRELLL